VVCQTAPVVSFIPEMAVFDLPMVFAKYDGDKIDTVLNSEDSEFNKSLSSAYDAAGFKLLGFLQNATFRLTTSNKELKTLDDFKGLKIRTMENSNHMAFWSAIGAAPTPLAWAEVYISLQNGTIDAEENAADTCVGANFQEVQKYLACTNHILYANQISINKDNYEKLDPLYQQALQQAVSEAIDEMRPQLEKIDTDSKKTLEDGGMTITEYDDSFYDQVLALDGVKDLYKQIDESVNGLGTTLQNELEK
jgi:TRAP-type C4-dicarboxylate transport system substrate-binding protein